MTNEIRKIESKIAMNRKVIDRMHFYQNGYAKIHFTSNPKDIFHRKYKETDEKYRAMVKEIKETVSIQKTMKKQKREMYNKIKGTV